MTFSTSRTADSEADSEVDSTRLLRSSVSLPLAILPKSLYQWNLHQKIIYTLRLHIFPYRVTLSD